MKNTDLFSNVAIGVLIITIIIVGIFKFVLKNDSTDFDINDIKEVVIKNMDGEDINLSELINSNFDTYMLILEINNCPPCVFKGIEDLKSLKKAGKVCFVIVVHEWLEEVKGWRQNYEFSPFYILSKNEFYDSFNVAHLPAIIKIEDGKIRNVRYITN